MGKQIEKWVDLSILPTHGKCIDWNASVGHSIPFQYGDVRGVINVIAILDKHNAIMATIDKYMPVPQKIYISNLRNCELRKFVHNKVADVRPELVQYLDNPQDAYLYSFSSHTELPMHCPICGHRKIKSLNELSQQGYCCPICGKGFSYPAKLMTNILSMLKIPFIREASKKHIEFLWAEDYRYDFYIRIGSRRIIIEMDGWFHQFNKERDEIKTKLANNNGFEVIRIDCDYTYADDRFEYIKQNIINSPLSTVLNLNNVDFNECNNMALTYSPIQSACDLWEHEHKSVKEIAEILMVVNDVARKYLKIGHSAGMCPSYNHIESEIRSHSRCTAFIDENQDVKYVFRSRTDASNASMGLFGVFVPICTVGHSCCHCVPVKGLNFRNITYDDYIYYKQILNQQYKLTEINNKQLKEVS